MKKIIILLISLLPLCAFAHCCPGICCPDITAILAQRRLDGISAKEVSKEASKFANCLKNKLDEKNAVSYCSYEILYPYSTKSQLNVIEEQDLLKHRLHTNE